MIYRFLFCSTILVFQVFFVRSVIAADDKERAAVEKAVLDYIEGIYTADAARIKRCVHPQVAKLGFAKRQDGYRLMRMSFLQFIEKVKNENRIPKNAVKEVVVFEVMDQTATAKVVAWWGVDYMHLAKFNGKWKIVNVLWQSYPDGQTRTETSESSPP